MNTRMKHTLVEGLVVGTIKGVVDALVEHRKRAVESVRRMRAFEAATTAYQNLGDNPSDLQIADYVKLMDKI